MVNLIKKRSSLRELRNWTSKIKKKPLFKSEPFVFNFDRVFCWNLEQIQYKKKFNLDNKMVKS